MGTKNLKKAVRRNLERFPSDFMFELSNNELNSLKVSMRFQFGASKQGGINYAPFAFTEQGIAMLSSVLVALSQLASKQKNNENKNERKPIGFIQYKE